MKRVRAGCISQTLVFFQKPDAGYTREQALKLNRAEVGHYRQTLERTRTRYQIISEQEEADGSVVLHVRKQYNDKAAVDEYFQQA
ncbi:MAG: hypothetical protein ACI4O7_01025 [Aristaeellaceae bacterium]